MPLPDLDDWQMWVIHKETSQGWLTFRSLLERQVLLREPVTDLAVARQFLRDGLAGDHVATMRVSRITDEQASPLLVAALDEPRLGRQTALALARLGTPEALQALVRRDVLQLDDLLLLAGNAYARDLLHERGHTF